MKALVIGFGKMGMLHAATLNALGAAGEIIICDPSALVREAVKAFCPERKVYADYREAIERESPGLAVLAAPNHAHFSIFSDLCRRGIHTFIEKPFVADADEARQACRIAAETAPGARAKVMIGYCLRFAPTFLLAKSILQAGALGKIYHFGVSMYSSDVVEAQGGWRFEKSKKGGGVLLDLGSHAVDMTRFLFGVPEKVLGTVSRWVSKDVEDYFSARFYYADFSGTLESSWSMPEVRKPALCVSVVGENGTLEAANDEVITVLKSEKPPRRSGFEKTDITRLSRPVPFDLAGPFYTEQWVELLEAIRSGKDFSNTISESLQNHELIDLIRRSEGVVRPVSRGGLL